MSLSHSLLFKALVQDSGDWGSAPFEGAPNPVLESYKQFANSVAGCDKVFAVRKSLAASGTQDYDFVGGGLTQIDASTMVLAKLKVLAVINNGNGTITFTSKAATGIANLFVALADGVVLKPGACFFFMDPTGVTVAAGADTLTLLETGGAYPADVDILVGGSSA